MNFTLTAGKDQNWPVDQRIITCLSFRKIQAHIDSDGDIKCIETECLFVDKACLSSINVPQIKDLKCNIEPTS